MHAIFECAEWIECVYGLLFWTVTVALCNKQ